MKYFAHQESYLIFPTDGKAGLVRGFGDEKEKKKKGNFIIYSIQSPP